MSIALPTCSRPARIPGKPVFLSVLLAFFLPVALLRAQEGEYDTKAAFLLNFTQFVQWPEEAFDKADAPFCIGILGEDPFGNSLEKTIAGQKVLQHKLSIHRARRIRDLKDCQMIFVCKSEDHHVTDILSNVHARPVVIVGESEGFARRGGTINFYRDQEKVRFEINPTAAQQCGLKISSQLLTLGKIVEPAGK